MNYKITNGSISYGAETILEEIDFEIKEKEKIAVVGRNGCGKSTLLKAIVNNQMLEEGIGEEKFGVYKQGSPVIGFLKQVEFEDESTSLLEEILKVYKKQTDLERRIENLEKALKQETSDKLVKEYTNAMDMYKFYDGYTYKKEYTTALNKFGFTTQDENKKISEFSGGQRTKIAFLRLLLSKPDILLLDEPTNHMDIVGKETLENLLKEYKGTLIFVSHDRYFVNKIADSLLVFEKNGAKYLNCSYDEYIENREEKEELFTTKKVKNKNNEYILNKERNKIKNKIKKLENEINANDLEIKRIEAEMQKEGINTDYVKLNELQEKITALNKQNEEKLIEWEALENKLS